MDSIFGRDLTARQILVFAALAMIVVTGLDLIDGKIGFLFSLGFVLVVATAPMAVELRGIALTGFLPPFLLIISAFVVALFAGHAIDIDGLPETASAFGRALALIVDRGVTLLVGTVLALAVIGARVWLVPAEDELEDYVEA
jgi:hypothetical protein